MGGLGLRRLVAARVLAPPVERVAPPPGRRGLVVVRAQAMGLCFGVRDALAMAHRVSRPQEVTIHGELVHNEAIQADLRRRGFVTTAEKERDQDVGALPTTEAVLITAHGVADRERRRLEV